MLSRRKFVARSISAVGMVGAWWPRTLLAVDRKSRLSDAQLRSLRAALAREDPNYDPRANLLQAPPNAAGYHTQLTTGIVHPTRLSLLYAAALFETGEPVLLERARGILSAVTALQDQDPASKTYGTWPWYLEEPLEKMAPPDWSWAGFCGVPLLMVWRTHGHELGESLSELVRESILHAARSVEAQDLAPHETDAAIMDTCLTLVAAQELKLPDLRSHAKDRLRKLHAYISRQGSLRVYNSPPFTVAALAGLSRMLLYVRDARDRQLIVAIHELAWRHAATHFHSPTRQWAGPHSRCHETDLRQEPSLLAFIESATGGKAGFDLGGTLPLSLEMCDLTLECPRRLIRYYTELPAPRQVVETFAKADPGQAGARNPIVGTTYLHPRFTLGSVNRGDFWRERRPLLAYWGNVRHCSYLRVRFLHDVHDFASALIFSTQHEDCVLSAVVLATDHGDKHPDGDPIRQAAIRARDLRLRFEFGGDLKVFLLRKLAKDRAIIFQDAYSRFVLQIAGATFDGEDLPWPIPEFQLAGPLDLVLYSGEEKQVDLARLRETWICFSLREWPYEKEKPPLAPVQSKSLMSRLHASWPLGDRTLELAVNTKPATFNSLNDSFNGGVRPATGVRLK